MPHHALIFCMSSMGLQQPQKRVAIGATMDVPLTSYLTPSRVGERFTHLATGESVRQCLLIAAVVNVIFILYIGLGVGSN